MIFRRYHRWVRFSSRRAHICNERKVFSDSNFFVLEDHLKCQNMLKRVVLSRIPVQVFAIDIATICVFTILVISLVQTGNFHRPFR